MSDIDILLFHKAYKEPPRFNQITRNKSIKLAQAPPISLDVEVIRPLVEQGIIARTFSSGPTKWQGIARIPLSEETRVERLRSMEMLEGRFKRLDIW